MAKAKRIGLSVLASIKAEAEQKAQAKAEGKSGKDGDNNPAYSADELERLIANSGVIVASDGTVLLKPANTGARRGRAPRLLIEATPESIDKLCEGLKLLVADEATMAEKVSNFKAWIAKQ